MVPHSDMYPKVKTNRGFMSVKLYTSKCLYGNPLLIFHKAEVSGFNSATALFLGGCVISSLRITIQTRSVVGKVVKCTGFLSIRPTMHPLYLWQLCSLAITSRETGTNPPARSIKHPFPRKTSRYGPVRII